MGFALLADLLGSDNNAIEDAAYVGIEEWNFIGFGHMTEEQAKLRAKCYPLAIERIESAITDYERETGEVVHNIGLTMLDVSTMNQMGVSVRTITLSAYLPAPESDS